MASSSARVVHQDYIARIRYSNNLPPPPNPPKLLDIPNTGLTSGQYTSAGFASRLAREQPLNIEADAELGMPIDLVGLPGVFDGDESVIEALENPPAPHPHDRPLLRPLATLGKPASITSGVSFLRRTEYITSAQGGSRLDPTNSKDPTRTRNSGRKRRRPDVAKDDPISILRAIIKSFDVAYPKEAYTGPDTSTHIRGAEITSEERAAWNNPRHPTKPDLRLLDAYPVLPDLDALPDTGGYMVVKFRDNPMASIDAGDDYDPRLDVGLLRPLDMSAESRDKYERQTAIHAADPSQPPPVPAYDYEFFVPASAASVGGVKRKFSVADPDADDDALYDYASETTGRPAFKYERVRAYETYQQTAPTDDLFEDTVAVALHDADDSTKPAADEDGDGMTARRRLQKAAYYYPVLQRAFIRPRRAANVAGVGIGRAAGGVEEDKIDAMELTVRKPTEEEAVKAKERRAVYDKGVAVGA